MPQLQLKGITSGHGRVIPPLLSIWQRAESHPDVEITRDARSLQAFAGQSPEHRSFAYTNSNHSRPGSSRYVLEHMSAWPYDGVPYRTTIGVTFFSVSVLARHGDDVLGLSSMNESVVYQRSVSFQHVCQPVYRSTWTDQQRSHLAYIFFRSILPVMDTGYSRPRHNGYFHFQGRAGLPVADSLMRDYDPGMVFYQMNGVCSQSLSKQKTTRTI